MCAAEKAAALRRYAKPFVFGLMLGLIFSSLDALRKSTNCEIHDIFWNLDFNRRCFAEAFHLRERGEQLMFWQVMVNDGFDYAFRFAVFTTFFAFVLNQATGGLAVVRDHFLNFLFGTKHYSIIGLLTGMCAKIFFGTIASVWVLVGLLAVIACIANQIGYILRGST